MPNYNSSYQNSTGFSSKIPHFYIVKWIKLPEHHFTIEELLSGIPPQVDICPINEARFGATSYKDLLKFVERYVIRKKGKRIGRVIEIKEEENYRRSYYGA